MSNPTPAAIAAHYRNDVAALSTPDLLRMVRGEFVKGTPKFLKRPLQDLANDIAQERGITLPLFAALTATI